jgi:L-fuculokinase
VGIGLHDSSSALIPYIINFEDPFVLLSTGTWVITMNPFNDKKLTFDELQNDCLCFLQYKGKPVKASRLFAGNEHEIQSLKLAKHFNVAEDSYKHVLYDKDIITKLRVKFKQNKKLDSKILKNCPFNKRDLSKFENYDEAYHQLILDLVAQQIVATNLVIHNSPVKKVFVDGGFSKNSIYMNLLAEAFPNMEVYAASMAQASSIGAALAIHKNWNTKPIQNDLIDLKFYKH